MMISPERTIALITGAMFNAEKTWNSFLQDASSVKKTTILLTIPLIVVSALITYVAGFFTDYGAVYASLNTGFFGTIVRIVTSLLGIALFALILSSFAAVFGGRSNFALGLAAISLAFVPGILGQAFAWLPWVGGVLAIVLAFYSLLQLYRIIPLYLAVPNEKRGRHYVLSLVSVFIVFAVFSMVMNPMIGASATATSGPKAGGILSDIQRQATIIESAKDASYDPPADGRLSERQVRSVVKVLTELTGLRAERMDRVKALAAEAKADKDVSIVDYRKMMSGMREVQSMTTAEMEIVAAAGGNWAEHQWVRETLRTASLQKSGSDAITHNFALYEKYADQIATAPR